MADSSPRRLSHFVVLKEHMAVMLCVLSAAKREGDRQRDGAAMAAFAFEKSQEEGSPGSDEALMQELAALYMARRPCARFTCVILANVIETLPNKYVFWVPIPVLAVRCFRQSWWLKTWRAAPAPASRASCRTSL